MHSLELNAAVKVGEIEIIPRRALDADVDSIFHLNAGGMNVLNVVDSWIDDHTLATLARSAPWDVVLWPFQTMRELEVIAPMQHLGSPPEIPPEWIEQLKVLRPRFVVPSSCQFIHEPWSWYNQAFFPVSYAQFTEVIEASELDTRVVRINPSCSFTLDQHGLTPAAPLAWITPVGDQDVDYAYDPNARPTPMTEVARQFTPLTSAQTARVNKYCEGELAARYRDLDHEDAAYFCRSRLWRLAVYDHLGNVRDVHYRVHHGSLERTSVADSDTIEWCTEIAEAKLHAALDEGEAMSSLYLRINGISFDAKVAADLMDADVMEDPLVRCLYTGVFGAYQIAQLKRLGYGD